MVSNAPPTSFVSASNVISPFFTSILSVRFEIFDSFVCPAENLMCPVGFASHRFSRTLRKTCNCLRRATTQKSSPWHNHLRSPSWLQKNARHTIPTFMEPSDRVSHQIVAASHVPYMLRQSLANVPFCNSERKVWIHLRASPYRCALDTSHDAISIRPSAWFPSSCPVIIVVTSI